MPSLLPLEIEEIILNLLAEEDKGRSTLKTCSLVCQAFLPICRRHIFGNITLHSSSIYVESPPSRNTIHDFDRLLRETPEIADYIRKLDYTIPIANLDSSGPLIQDSESLKRISRLEFLTVRDPINSGYGPRLDWGRNPIRPALLHLLHLPTLTHLLMSGINDFIVSDLIPCVNLKYLHITNYMTAATENTFPAALPEHSIQLNEFEAGYKCPAVIMKLCTTRRPDGQPIIDFGSLSKLTVNFDEPDNIKARIPEELFRRCHSLTNAHISFCDSHRSDRSSLADMLRPSMQTLKHIFVYIVVDEDDVDPLFGIPSELEDMRTKNIIETITFEIVVPTDGSCRRGDDWGRLDKVLTSPGWFSLEQVSMLIEITIDFRRDRNDDDDELEEALQNLPETQFPRLSSSNSVSFNFEVNSVLGH